MKHYVFKVSVYSVTHFLVDFACAFLMFRSIAGTPDGYLCVLLYNFCAFALQMPLGIIADKLNRNFLVAMIGCILVGLAFGFVYIPVAATIVVGIGNAMFHIGGGIDILNISGKKLGALGIFVSPGAFGIYFGTIAGKGDSFLTVLVPITLILATGFIFAAHKTNKGSFPKNAEFSLSGGSVGNCGRDSDGKSNSHSDSNSHSISASAGIKHVFTAIACLFSVVCLRSFAGLALDFPWKSVGHWGAVLICAVVFGKTLGGFAADRFGLKPTALISLGLASLMFLFPEIPLIGVAAVLLFNMTMPITLWAMAKVFPSAKGFAFGLLTFGLFLGFLPVYFGFDVSSAATWLFALLAAISLGLLRIGLRRGKL